MEVEKNTIDCEYLAYFEPFFLNQKVITYTTISLNRKTLKKNLKSSLLYSPNLFLVLPTGPKSAQISYYVP
jgi:hypothetical protein